MKRIIVLTLLLALAGSLSALELDLGLYAGQRTVQDSNIRDLYGNNPVWSPRVRLGLAGGFSLGACYEGGYEEDAPIGIYNFPSTLKLSAFEFFAAYHLKLGRVEPYARVGVNFQSYKHTVTGAPVDYKVDDSKTTWSLAGGLRVFLVSNLYLAGEVAYSPLKVEPIDTSIKLGGARYLLGAGYVFGR